MSKLVASGFGLGRPWWKTIGSTARLFAVSIREDRSSSTRPAGPEGGVMWLVEMDAAEFGHET